MEGVSKEKIERTRAYLLASGLPEDTKDGLQSLLDAAGNAANGAEDKMQALSEAMLALALHEVRQAVRMPAGIAAAVQDHAVKCQLASPGGWQAMVIRLRWPLALVVSVAFLSPNFGQIAEVVRGLIH